MRRLVWLGVAVAIGAMLVAVRIHRVHQKESATVIAAVPVPVDTAIVTQGSVVRTRHVLGRVIGADEVEVSPQVMAQVLEVRVREGDVVRRGDVVVLLDGRELEDAVAQAEARVRAAAEGLAAAETARAARRDATARDQRLFEATAISEEQWDLSRATDAAAAAHLEAARAELSVAEKGLDRARTRLDYCRVTAPVNGMVARRLGDPGGIAAPGKPLLELVRQDSVRVQASVPSETLTEMAVGQQLTLRLGDHAFQSAVSRIFPAMGASHLAVFETDLDAPPPGLVSGATVGVDLHLSPTEGLVVPADALVEGESGAWVFTVTDETVHLVAVTVLDRSNDSAAVSGQLEAGDVVIVARLSRLMTLADGMKVRVAAATS